jgi:hypothetical protein
MISGLAWANSLLRPRMVHAWTAGQGTGLVYM